MLLAHRVEHELDDRSVVELVQPPGPEETRRGNGYDCVSFGVWDPLPACWPLLHILALLQSTTRSWPRSLGHTSENVLQQKSIMRKVPSLFQSISYHLMSNKNDPGINISISLTLEYQPRWQEFEGLKFRDWCTLYILAPELLHAPPPGLPLVLPCPK